MLYEALKGLVDGLKTSYKCPECSSAVGDNNIDIVGAAGTTVNFDIECPECGKHGIIKSQMTMLDLGQMKQSIETIKNKLKGNNESVISITDSEIVELDKDLKNKQISASDLFE